MTLTFPRRFAERADSAIPPRESPHLLADPLGYPRNMLPASRATRASSLSREVDSAMLAHPDDRRQDPQSTADTRSLRVHAHRREGPEACPLSAAGKRRGVCMPLALPPLSVLRGANLASSGRSPALPPARQSRSRQSADETCYRGLSPKECSRASNPDARLEGPADARSLRSWPGEE